MPATLASGMRRLAEAGCAKRDHPEQRVVVIAIDRNLMVRCRNATTTTASMAAMAVVRSVYLETFGGDVAKYGSALFNDLSTC